jgi:hypothetical protein
MAGAGRNGMAWDDAGIAVAVAGDTAVARAICDGWGC